MARAAGDSLLSTPRGQLVVMCGCGTAGAGARKAGPPCHASTGGGLQGCPRGVSDPGGPRRSSNAARAPAASAPRLDLWHFTGVVHQPGGPHMTAAVLPYPGGGRSRRIGRC